MGSMTLIDELRGRELDDLLRKAWGVRKENFSDVLTVSTPGAKTYISDHHRNERGKFANISITGTGCALDCDHCKKGLLESMIPVTDGGDLRSLGDELVERGCEGVLISGGAMITGEVPLDGFFDALCYLKEIGLTVLVHTGLATRETARRLKDAGVDQALLDVIGARETIKRVYHLDRKPSDFAASMEVLSDVGLDVIPHIVVGLDFGRVVGEYRALEMVTRIDPGTIVIVVLTPMAGTPMEDVNPPEAEDVARLTTVARIMNPEAYLTLGCARPPGNAKVRMERYAVDGGITGIAYPRDETIEYAEELGFEIVYQDMCCSLL